MLQPITELERFPAISAEPHSIAVAGPTVWIGSRATRRIDVIDRASWKKTGEIEPPGMPWGMTFGNGALLMACGEGAEDDRRIYRFVPGVGFDANPITCPDYTGAHLAVYNGSIMLAQWYKQVLLALDSKGSVVRSFASPHGIAGVAIKGDHAYTVATDDEDDGDYWITRIDLQSGQTRDLALIPFPARGLAWDGERFWTNHRAGDRTIAFHSPE